MILDALHHQITHELVQIVETRCSARSDGVLDPPLCGYIFISYSMSTLFVFGNHVCTVDIYISLHCVCVWLIDNVCASICVSVYLLLCSVFVWCICFCLCLCVYVSVCFVFCCNVVSLCYLYNRVQSAGGVSPLNASQTAPVPSPALLLIIIIVPGESSILTIKMMTILTTTDFQLSVSLFFLSMCFCLESLSWVSAGGSRSQTQLNRETSTVSLN